MDLFIGKVLPSVCMVLLLSSVSNCEPNCTDIRLFNAENRPGEGRVEIFCNGHWDTISSDDTNIDLVVCRYQGFGQNWRPNRTTEFGEGFGSVWNVSCSGKELKIQECCITPTDPADSYTYELMNESMNFLFFNHSNDIGVKCRGQYLGDLSKNDDLHGDVDGRPESHDSVQHGTTSSAEEETIVHGNSPAMIVVDVVGFALVLAAIAFCGFVIYRRLLVNSSASKEKDQSQTLLSPSSHVTIHAETICQHQPEERGLVHTEESGSHGPALTEVNPVYEPAIEMAETSLIGKGQESKELVDTSYPNLTEVNPCYGTADEITGRP